MSKETKPASPRSFRAMPTLPLWLTGIFLVAVAAVTGLILVENYKSSLAAGEARAMSSAHVVAAHVEWMMEASNQALRRIDSALGDEPIDSPQNSPANIAEAVGDLPSGFEYSVFDANGLQRLSSAQGRAPLNHGGRGYFERLRKGEPMTVSRLFEDERTAKPSFMIGRRITRNGAFVGVATIAIPNETMDRFWASMGLGEHSTVSAVRDDGWLVARRPVSAEAIDLSTTEWYPMTRGAQSGVYHSAVSPIDGYARIVGFWKVRGWPLIALTAIERQEVLDQFWNSVWSDALFAVPLVVVLVLASIWITRLLYRYAARNEELEQALERNRFLLREIHHRVKNNLQAVLALVRLQPLPPEARNDMTRRVGAMIAVHEQIYQKDQFERVDVAPYAEKIIRDLAAAYDMPVTLDLALQSVTVDREQALPLGMIINEVVSNAFKYAFTERARGTLTVSLEKQPDQLCLRICDDGPGLGSEAERRVGMGSKLIGSFVKQLQGRHSLRNENGAVFEMTAPLSLMA
ncbi:sensor histidine kinase [Neorhizobium sp. NPDC001467]|uniref:sensor histidine kinase n=1 Tax=Neorhizobium sp. NPDC001467 TaxID=3390595 RepID=UPI003D0453BD